MEEAGSGSQQGVHLLTLAMRVVLVVAAVTAIVIPPKEVPYICPGECPFFDVPGPTYDYLIGLRLVVFGAGVGMTLLLYVLQTRLHRSQARGRSDG
jgi:hypothetical protein